MIYVESSIFTQYRDATSNTIYDAKLSCVTLQTAKTQKHKSIWYSPEQFDYKSYYAEFANDMLNQEPIITKYQELYSMDFSKWYKIFVRPNSGDKIFEPHYHYYTKNWDKSLRIVQDSQSIEGEAKCIISPFITIYDEYRIIIIDNKIITGSSYRICGDVEFVRLEELPDHKIITEYVESLNFDARAVPNRNGFVVDIHYDGKSCSIVEFNSLSCSDWYESDVCKVRSALENFNK